MSPPPLSGTGTAGVFGIDVDVPVTRVFLVEPGLRFLRYQAQFGSHVSLLMPEVSLQLQIPNKWARPYVAAGGGFAVLLEDQSGTDLTLHGGLVLKVRFGRFGLRPEARLRSIDFAGTTFDATLGFSYGF